MRMAAFLIRKVNQRKERRMDMKEFWNTIQFIFAAVGNWFGYFVGGCDGLLYTLIGFIALDYVTGVMCAVSDRKLSSKMGFKGDLPRGTDLCAGRHHHEINQPFRQEYAGLPEVYPGTEG